LWKEIISQRSGAIGIFSLLFLAILAVLAPLWYGKYYSYWRNNTYWSTFPKAVPPDWVNVFNTRKLPPTKLLEPINVSETQLYGTIRNVTFVYQIMYTYDEPPSDIVLIFNLTYQRSPIVNVVLVRPDGESIKILSSSLVRLERILQLNKRQEVRNKVYTWLLSKGVNTSESASIIPTYALFTEGEKTLRGRYYFIISVYVIA
jgi:peptide/nickel transport system permease protein